MQGEQREQAITRLDALCDELSKISTWLGRVDEDQAAILLEDAWRDLQAACHVLTRRERRHPAGWLGGEQYAEYGPQPKNGSAMR